MILFIKHGLYEKQFMFSYKLTGTVGQKKKKNPYLFQCKLSYRNETGTNHYELLSTSL